MDSSQALPIAGIKQVVVQSHEGFPQQAVRMARLLNSLIGFRDQYTSSHSARVAKYVRAIATQLCLADEEMETAVLAASLHDIGKTGIPDHILLKRGKLSDEEFGWIHKYPEWGWDTLRQVEGLEQAADLVLHQHEHIDGSGYPQKLRGEAIPLGSRIIAVADSFDALTMDRPYHPALSHAAALAELARCSGTQFDADVVNAFRVLLEHQTVESELS